MKGRLNSNWLRTLYVSPKSYYKRYLADDTLYELNYRLVDEILKYKPSRTFEFGCGTGKIMQLLEDRGVALATGIDISKPAIKECQRKALVVQEGDEDVLPTVGNADVAYTCSVLDHIPRISGIVNQLCRIAPVVIAAETKTIVGKFYYDHDYEMMGFSKLDYEWKSPKTIGDDAVYNIYVIDNRVDKAINYINDGKAGDML